MSSVPLIPVDELTHGPRPSSPFDIAGLERELRKHVSGEVRFDAGSKALYATDASNYRQVPIGVVLPHDVNDVVATIAACRKFQVPVLSRTGNLLSAHGLELDVAELTPFARWVPKFHAVRRFDTLFYVALCPGGDWQPRVIEGECAGAAWLTAAAVLEREQRGKARLIFPTRRTLERLAQHGSFDAIRADAVAHPIEPVTPWVEERDGEKFITIPAHLGFPVTHERLDGLWRG